jgi:hypothetical protein
MNEARRTLSATRGGLWELPGFRIGNPEHAKLNKEASKIVAS